MQQFGAHLGVLGEAEGVEGASRVLPLLGVGLAVPERLGPGNGHELLQKGWSMNFSSIT